MPCQDFECETTFKNRMFSIKKRKGWIKNLNNR
jgi:hypothetical protein